MKPVAMKACTPALRRAWSVESALALVLAGSALFGCGGGGGGGGSGGGGSAPPAPAQPPTAQAGSVSLDVRGTSASTVSGKVTASDPQGLALTYAVTTAPSVGTVTLDARSGSFTYAVSGHTTSSQDSFTVAVSNGQAAATANALVTVRLNSDPLLPNQWHIHNAGATAFAGVLPTAGNDMNVAGAWAAGFSGRGIKIAVVDSGLEVAHEDLAVNVDLANSFNFLTATSDPTRDASHVGPDHGTQVAGIIGAAAFNGKGGRGVAYNARLRGYNYLRATTAMNYKTAMGGAPVSADNAVFNASFAASGTLAPPLQALVDVDNGLGSLRGGLGAVMVMSAGNEFLDFDDGDAQRCADANQRGVSCGNPAQETSMGAPTPIVVGALDAHGKRASYSNTGSSLWVAAPGGEYGFDSTYFDVSRLRDPSGAVKPAIVTSARSGCTNRSNAPAVANALVTGNHRQALSCQYTAQMNGTSAAAPNASAVVALMLEANPRLTARDVKFILAKTAKRIDPGLASVTDADLVPRSTITLEQGWVRNAAGFWFSNSYGFGAVDAAAAVEMARTTTSLLPPSRWSGLYSSTPRASEVPADSAEGFRFTAQVNETFTTVERVLVTVNLGTTPAATCNQIEVLSPSGTRSILLHAANGYGQTSVSGTRFVSNAFYGEPVNGAWKFTYFNFCPGQTLLSATQPQSIEFYGR